MSRAPHQLQPRRTVLATEVRTLEGGNEDNDLWVEVRQATENIPVHYSTWVPTDDQRKQIAEGANIEVGIWGPQPPMAVSVSEVKLGKGTDVDRLVELVAEEIGARECTTCRAPLEQIAESDRCGAGIQRARTVACPVRQAMRKLREAS